MKQLLFLLISVLLFNCNSNNKKVHLDYLKYSENILDYHVTPKNKFDKSGLMFSDQGAWFAYSFPEKDKESFGFTGPFLMTQQNGIWLASSFSDLIIKENNTYLDFKHKKTSSYSSHLEQNLSTKDLIIEQKLVFKNGHTSLLKTRLKNTSNKTVKLELIWGNSPILADGIELSVLENNLLIDSKKSTAKGYLVFPKEINLQLIDSNQYKAEKMLLLKPNETKELIISQSFIFPKYDWESEYQHILSSNFDTILKKRKEEKNAELKSLLENKKEQFFDKTYNQVLAKSHLTLQNNWRIPAGEIKHEGLFPSYHYKWFNGFWAWDSWKHAVGLSYYNTELAKKQMKLMFEFQKEDGFIVDCVFRDTLIEKHNYRDTKPPLSAWAVSKIYNKDNDIKFVKYMYPKLKLYHQFWYLKRDHDKDGLCEFGSTDGTLIAAKWESGMDNAIRFDNSKVLKNGENAYSLNQESVDLNAYLYAEKIYLIELATLLNKNDDIKIFTKEGKILKDKIQTQFFDENDGWFYDTSIDGKTLIKGEGSEGWTTLWANAATQEQAESIKDKMMNSKKFFTKVPFQSMSADHQKFNPLKGYWRGPNWLDQAYFGVKGLINYGFNKEANKATVQILKGAEGVLEKGKAIRENYHPITGKGLNAQNFSWSAAHIIMLLQNN